jgi:peptide/nickel transport system permease protein
MLAYAAKRVVFQLLVLLASSVVIFGMLRLAPGDPAVVLLGGHTPTKAAIENIRHKYDLDKPLPVQYGKWLSRIAQGDFGESVSARDTVWNVLKPRLETTALLTLYATLIMVVVGIPLGIASAVFRNGGVDVAATAGALGFAAIPAYVTGLILILLFGIYLNWFPTIGGGENLGIVGRLDHLTLPAIALALSAMALISRVTRASMITALDSEHVETARIRGFSERRVIFKHALRSALVPVITIAGVQAGYLIAGAILIEYTFGLNGLGTLLVNSVQNRDYAVVQAIALIIVAAFLFINLVVDLLYGVIDPRVRLVGRANR